MEKLPNNKYQRFCSAFESSKKFLLLNFLRSRRFSREDYMPMSKGHINYVRWHRVYDDDTDAYTKIMRDYSRPIVNFYYLNDLIHLFLYAGSGNDAEESQTYGHYDYNDKKGTLRYKISYKDPYKKDSKGNYIISNGHPIRIKGTGDKIMSKTASPKGIYSPMSGIHSKVHKFGHRWNQYFHPEVSLYNAQGKHVGFSRIHGNNQIQHFLFPVEDAQDEGKLEQDILTLIDSIYSNFNGNDERRLKSYALFLAFLVGEYENKIDGFKVWQHDAPRGMSAWRSVVKNEAEKIIDEYEKGYEENQLLKPNPNAITNRSYELHDPEPINSTPEKIMSMKAIYDELYGKEIGESVHRKLIVINEEQFKKLLRLE